MISPKDCPFCRAGRWFAERIMISLCVLQLLPAGYGQTDHVGELIAALNTWDGEARSSAAAALGATKDPRAVKPLIALLKDPDYSVRDRARDALVEIGAPAVELLIVALRNTDSDVRDRATRALGALKDPRAVEPLIMALKDDPDSDVRKSAAAALGAAKDPRAVEPLIVALKAPDALRIRDSGVGMREFKDPASLPKDADWKVRKNAAEALGALKDHRAVEPLIAALEDWNSGVRDSAAGALKGIGAPAVEPLIAALRDPNAWLRLGAARVLGERREPRVVNALLNASGNRDPAVLAGAYQLFINRGKPGSENALIQALTRFGSEDMAEALLNCGNLKLEAVAREWFTARGFFVHTMFGVGGASWGSGR